MIPFVERANKMNLNTELDYKGLFSYKDRYGEVVYRTLTTVPWSEQFPDPSHETDGRGLSYLAVYTKEPQQRDYVYCGIVSQIYRFIGHDVVNEMIRKAITEAGTPVVEERFFSNYLTRMRTEFVISSAVTSPVAGDILPVIITGNSYDGNSAAKVSFGLLMNKGGDKYSFAFKLGEMREVHIAKETTTMTANIQQYIQAFGENIVNLIGENFKLQLTEEAMLSALAVVEKIGKKKREAVSTILSELQTEAGQDQPSAWLVFLAIVRYSSFERNLNIRRLLESAAESVLVVPGNMMNVLEKLG
jgi:hypothetical protein